MFIIRYSEGLSTVDPHFVSDMCGLAGFGDACLIDHHYHYGCPIHAAASILYMKPEIRDERGAIAHVSGLIRDFANPNAAGPHPIAPPVVSGSLRNAKREDWRAHGFKLFIFLSRCGTTWGVSKPINVVIYALAVYFRTAIAVTQ